MQSESPIVGQRILKPSKSVPFDLDASRHGVEDSGAKEALQGYEKLSSAIKRLHKQFLDISWHAGRDEDATTRIN